MRDYAALADLLGASLLDRNEVLRSRVGRAIACLAGPAAALAWLAFRRGDDFDVIVTDGEHVGIPLAALLRASRTRVRHVTIGHRLSSRKKRLFFKILHVERRIDRIALHSRRQFEHAVGQLGIGAERLSLIPYQVDTDFWAPRAVAEERLVVSAGLEHRDYGTLFRAVEGLDAEVVIGAASHWSKHGLSDRPHPSNVRIGSFDYEALRDLYARASVVVVPLVDVDNQAGVTTILEAMAMAKAVIVSQSLGQTDVVEDRRATARGAQRPRPTSLARALAERSGVRVEPNGFYVPPGDPAALRSAIAYLLDHPQERAALGRAGRRLAEELFTVRQFAERMRAIVDEAIRPSADTVGVRRASYG